MNLSVATAAAAKEEKSDEQEDESDVGLHRATADCCCCGMTCARAREGDESKCVYLDLVRCLTE